LVSFLDGKASPRSLWLGWGIRADVVLTFERHQLPPKALWIGGLRSHSERQSGGLVAVDSHLGYRWLRVNWAYDDRFQSTGPELSDPDLALAIAYNASLIQMAKMGLAIEARRWRDGMRSMFSRLRPPQ
jgi:hypothetical protein